MGNSGVAAIDIGLKMHMAAANSDSADMPARMFMFGLFTQDLHDLADWVPSCDVTGVAVASTGVYPMPAFEIPEQHRFDVYARERASCQGVVRPEVDVSDAGWVRQLHSHALLRGSFRPEAEIATLRACMWRSERWIA